MARQSRRYGLFAPPAHRRSKFVRPRCEPLECRLNPADLFNVHAAMSFNGLNNNGCVAVADFNHDGYSDAILTNYGSAAGAGDGTTITVLKGQAGATPLVRQTALSTGGTNVSFVEVGDLDGDGWTDAVAVSANQQGNGTMTVFKNDGAGHLSAAAGGPYTMSGSNNTCCVRLVDVTGDGILDAVVASFGKDPTGNGEEIVGNKINIFQGNGDFTFSPIAALSPDISFIPTALAVADFDGDGKVDIAAVSSGIPPSFEFTNYPPGIVWLFPGNGGGGFGNPTQVDTGGVLPVNIQAADLDGNGKTDLIVANAGNPNGSPEFVDNSVGVLLNFSSPGSISFDAPTSLITHCYGTFAVAAADFNLDGKVDIASINYGNTSFLDPPEAFVSVYLGDGTGSFTDASPATYDTQTGFAGGQYLAVGDFDANGTPDLIVAHAFPAVGLLLNTTVIAPTATINQAVGQADPTNGTSVRYTATFSMDVTGFDGSDVDLSGSSVAGLTASVTQVSPRVYTVTVTGPGGAPLSGTGTIRATIPAGAAESVSGAIPSLVSTSTDNQVAFDLQAPTVTINQAATQVDPTTTGPIKFTVVFSENVTGFGPDDVSTAGSTVGGSLSVAVTPVNQSTYTVSVTGMTGTGTVVANVVAGAAIDAVRNPSEASTSTDNSVLFGSAVAPTVTINQAAGQPDPTNASPITFAVHFDQPVTGFDESDVVLTGTLGGALVAVVGGPSPGQDYTVTVTGMTGTGTVVATVNAGAAVNNVGTASAASSSTDNSVTFDDVRPTVTVEQAADQPDPTNVSSIRFTVKFSEPVTGFNSASVSTAGSTAGGTLQVAVSGNLDTYTVTVTGMTTRGLVMASVLDGAATDAAGNLSQVSTSTDNAVEFLNTGTVGFTNVVFDPVSEPDAPQIVFITVTRAGQTDGAVSVHFGTRDGTAHSGGNPSKGQADYTLIHDTLTGDTLSWADGEGGDKTFKVEIEPDDFNEGKEIINLTLDTAVGSPGLGLMDATVAIKPSDGRVIDALAKVPAFTFFDNTGLQGDIVTVRLVGKVGTATVYLTDPNGTGNGPPEWIDLANTLPNKSALTITVKKPRGAIGDGRTTLAELSGSGLRSLAAGTTDLIGTGIHLDDPVAGFLGTINIGNVSGGADIIVMGAPPARPLGMTVRITAGVIADGTDIRVPNAPLSTLTAIAVGDGTVSAPRIGTITAKGKAKTKLAPAIPGNFNSDVTVTGVGVDPRKFALTRLRAAGSVAGAAISVGGKLGWISVGGRGLGDFTGAISATGNLGSVAVAGNVNGTPIDVGGNIGSISVGGRGLGNFTGTIHAAGNLGSVTVGGKVDGTLIDVGGNVRAVSVGSFWNSRLDAGYTGTDDGNGVYTPNTIGSFRVTAKDKGFQSSNVIAWKINTVFLASVNGDNPPNPTTHFGITADAAIRSAVVMLPKKFTFLPGLSSPQTLPELGMFQVTDRNGPFL
jgi:hypothetical protein